MTWWPFILLIIPAAWWGRFRLALVLARLARRARCRRLARRLARYAAD